MSEHFATRDHDRPQPLVIAVEVPPRTHTIWPYVVGFAVGVVVTPFVLYLIFALFFAVGTGGTGTD